MLTDLDPLITALYVEIDDRLPRTRRMGRPPKLSDAELVTLAVAQALLGITSESRWLRIAAIRMLSQDTDLWHDDIWLVDSTPVECARSRETVKRSDLAGWAAYGYCGRPTAITHPAPASTC